MFLDNDSVIRVFQPSATAPPSLASITVAPTVAQWLYPFQTTTVSVWATDQPDLTVDDLADSIEAMLARRESGLSAPTTIMQMRNYPTDPSTQRSVVSFLKDLQSEKKSELASVNEQLVANQKSAAEAKAKAELEAKEFATWKASDKSATV